MKTAQGLVWLLTAVLLGACMPQISVFHDVTPASTVLSTPVAPSTVPLPTLLSPSPTLYNVTPIPVELHPTPSTESGEEKVTQEQTPVIFYPVYQPVEEWVWQKHSGRFDVKDTSVHYSLLYPAEWFIYTDPSGSLQIQNFSRDEMLKQGVTNMAENSVKIEVNFAPCDGDGCIKTWVGEPIVLSGLSGTTWMYYDELFDTTIQEIALPVDGGTLQLTILVGGKPQNVATRFRMAIGYILSSLSVWR